MPATTHTILESDGNDGWQVATIGDVRCARLAPSRENNRLIPPAWIRQGYQPDTIPETEIWEDVLDDDGNVTGRQPTGTSQRMTPDFLVGKKFAKDIDSSPVPGEYERLGDWPDEPDSIDTENWTATWVRPVIAADDFDPATHHAPVWDADAGEWLAPVAKTTEELAAEFAGKVAAVEAAAAAMLDPTPGVLGTIDLRAQVERGKYATLAWAQERVYLDKEAEAIAWTANNDIDASEIPYLTAEATATGETVANLAAMVLANGAAWRALSVGIEARRLGLKAAVKAAELIATREDDPDPDAAMTALLAIDIDSGWPSP